MKSHRWVLASRPQDFSIASHLALEELDVASPTSGEFLVQTVYLRAATPMFKVAISGSADGRPPTPIGSPIVGAGIGRVLESENPAYPVGAYVSGSLPWQDVVLSDGRTVVPLQVFEPIAGVSLAAPLHVLGGPGLSAWFGLTEFATPKLGDTLVVSTAAGAVGAVVCQLAKLAGCRVIGITSTRGKGDWLVSELGIDAAIAYRTEDVAARLRELCPNGIDVYFDNVGGETLDIVLTQIAFGARVVLCGASSQYDRKANEWQGPKHYFELVYKQADMRGFYIFNFVARFAEGRARLGELLAAGKLRYTEDIAEGLENAPAAFDRVLAGHNLGTQLIKVER